jgi:hypothetical protein
LLSVPTVRSHFWPSPWRLPHGARRSSLCPAGTL